MSHRLRAGTEQQQQDKYRRCGMAASALLVHRTVSNFFSIGKRFGGKGTIMEIQS